MQKIPFPKKLVTCTLAGLVIAATTSRIGFTFLRAWVPARIIPAVSWLFAATAFIYAVIWQIRKTNHPATLAFWQGLIRYSVALDLATFGWEKLFHLQFVIPQSRLDIPLGSLSSNDLFWSFFCRSYPLDFIIAGCQIG